MISETLDPFYLYVYSVIVRDDFGLSFCIPLTSVINLELFIELSTVETVNLI